MSMMEKYPPLSLADLVERQLKDDLVSYPELKVVNGMVKIYEEPDSDSNYTKVPPTTRLTAIETKPSRYSKSIMAHVIGKLCKHDGTYNFYEGWVSLSSDNLVLI